MLASATIIDQKLFALKCNLKMWHLVTICKMHFSQQQTVCIFIQLRRKCFFLFQVVHAIYIIWKLGYFRSRLANQKNQFFLIKKHTSVLSFDSNDNRWHTNPSPIRGYAINPRRRMYSVHKKYTTHTCTHEYDTNTRTQKNTHTRTGVVDTRHAHDIRAYTHTQKHVLEQTHEPSSTKYRCTHNNETTHNDVFLNITLNSYRLR